MNLDDAKTIDVIIIVLVIEYLTVNSFTCFNDHRDGGLLRNIFIQAMASTASIHSSHVAAMKEFLDNFQAIHILAHTHFRRDFYRGEEIVPEVWGYITPSFKPTTLLFISKVLDKDSGTNYGIFPPPDEDIRNLDELHPGRLVLGNPGLGNTVLDTFYVKQMEHLREMMELEATNMGQTIVGVNLTEDKYPRWNHAKAVKL
ncbi:hypothetical protein BDN71DRAFT_1436575 [Pleurotus eryngii]|uniref:Uncharacterized protein n=1 Tax=Pleurotus eryngii TaxID=5323 RepID=A0A9P6D1S5_PLEER|nr:hypothetical protein BDN71DRAFT_1436575 [Pleurotus eryngii]